MGSLNQIFWASQEVYILKIFLPIVLGFLILSFGLIALFTLSFWWQHYRLWHLGKKENRLDHVVTRLKMALAVSFLHTRIAEEFYPGTMHFLILWGTLFILLGKTIRLFSYITGLTIPPQTIFLYASLISEAGGIFLFT